MPAVFERKRKWRDYEHEQAPSDCVRKNYPTAEANADRQFEQEAQLGAMVKLTLAQAQLRYGAQPADPFPGGD